MAKKSKTASRRSSSSSSSGGESNTGLIVTIVFFVLTTLTLGVFTYFGYSGQTELAANATKAKKEATDAKKAQDEAEVKRLVLAIATGNEAPGDQNKLAAAKGTASAAHTAAIAALKDITWQPNQERPAETYQDQFAKLKKERDSAINDKNTAEKNLAEARKAHEDSTKSLNDKLAKADENLKKILSDTTEEKRKQADHYLAEIKKIDTESIKLKDEKQARADDAAEADRKLKKAEQKADNFNKQLDEAKSKLTPLNSLDADTPKGKVLRVDREAGLVYINLGSADFVKPLLTFSVMPATGNGKTTSSKDRKGAIEIATVQGPNLSAARITDQTNAMRDPILPGDLIFNPSWNSNQREHVALAGIFDLDGDGRDDTLEVIRNLERQGIVVDAYLDMRDRSIKGPGITERTAYLVAGEKMGLSESVSRIGNAEDPNVQAVLQINGKIDVLEKAAKEKGVQTVSYRRYLTAVGYQLPKNTRPVDNTSLSYLKQTATAPKESPGEEKPK